MESEGRISHQEAAVESKEKESTLESIVDKLASLGQTVSDFLSDLSGVSNYLKTSPPNKIHLSPISISFKARHFSQEKKEEEIIFQDSSGYEHIISIKPDIELSEQELSEWKNFGKLPRSYNAEITTSKYSVRLHAERNDLGHVDVQQIGHVNLEVLQFVLHLIESAENLFKKSFSKWKVSDNKLDEKIASEKIYELYEEGGIIPNH